MPKDIKIAGKIIGDAHPCFIIAEAGSNHDGKYDQAIKLIDLAIEAGADAIKFQVFTASKIAAKTKHDIAKLNSPFGQDLYELYKGSELPREWLPNLKKYCDEKGIIFLATPFDYDAVDSLEEIDTAAYKIASFELVHLPLLKCVAKTGKPVILSTGMANMAEIETAVEAIKEVGNDNIIVLHCGISYPMPFNEVNIKAMSSIKTAFDVNVGYSDHTSGIIVPLVAVSLSGRVIEKHFTIDRSLPGPDHGFALGPDELKEMVKSIRIAERIMGNGIKKPTESEMLHKMRGRRSLFINKDLKKGHVLTLEDIEILRPGIGIEPKYLESSIGKELKCDTIKYTPLTWDLI